VKLNLFTDLGLRVLMRIAGEPNVVYSTGELAEDLEVSRNHLNKVVARMVKAGYITARRGKGGGISLAKPPVEIRIGDVIAELEHEIPIVDCFKADGGTCTLTSKCILTGRLADARRNFIVSLNQSTLWDVAIR